MSWNKPYDTVLFCPPTPKGILVKKLREIVELTNQNSGINIKVVERAGKKIRSIMPGLVVYRGRCITCEKRGKTSV